MKKDMIFFATDGKGLTSTSANHIANLAKEMIRNIETSLDDIVLYTTNVALIGNKNVNILNCGASEADVNLIADKLHQTASAKSLIAWLREAIKAKERLLDEANNLTLEEYAMSQSIELEKQPEIATILTEDEYFAAKPVDERCHYYELETLAATLGKAIHPGGAFADARNDLLSKSKKPHTVAGDGRDTLIYTYTPSVSQDVVEDVYFKLQKQYRETQARLNSMNHKCQKAINESAAKAKSDYAKALSGWLNNRKLLEAQHSEYIQQRVNEISSLRIIIPTSLSNIYQTVSTLGKN